MTLQWNIRCNVSVATVTDATTEELLEAVFSVGSAPRLYHSTMRGNYDFDFGRPTSTKPQLSYSNKIWSWAPDGA
jgi:hypothetical protein